MLLNSFNEMNLNKKYNIKEPQRNISYLPSIFRCLIVGSSGCGKTNLVLNLLFKIIENSKKPISIIICTKTIEQPLYKSFIKDMVTNYKNKVRINVFKEIKNFDDEFYKKLDKRFQNIVLIDDMLGVTDQEDKKSLIHLFSASRPRELSIFFLSQRYTRVEITCRNNLNYLIIFKPSYEEANTICNELLGTMVTTKEFLNKFESNSYFSLFCDLEKMKIKNVYEIFKISNHVFYKNVNDIIKHLKLLVGELYSGNDSKEIINDISEILIELDNIGIIEL
jgi:GTPase SAR1 family protein